MNDRVAVGGDSSGGNLAAAAALKARDEGVELAAQLLVYPVLDSTEDTDYKVAFRQRYATFAGRPGFGANSYRRLEHIWETYVPDPAARKAPYASPLHAESVDGVAPATIVTRLRCTRMATGFPRNTTRTAISCHCSGSRGSMSGP